MAARKSLWEKLLVIARVGCAAAGRRLTMGSMTTALGLVLALGSGCAQVTVNPVPQWDGGADAEVDEDGGVDAGDVDAGALDEDGDGWNADVDCNDADPNIHPGQPAEGCCPPRGTPDQNCDGVVGPDPEEPIACNCFYDEDGDGWGEGFGPGPDCDDTDATIHPEADEICGDGIDQNCDGEDAVCEEP